ncbi:MAG: ATP-binding protein [Candidatus Jacksonbacteria bacterium]
MISKDLLKIIILEQRKQFFDTKGFFKRKILDAPEVQRAICKTKEIIIISGVRRCGKSYLMRLIWQDIKKRLKTNDKQFFYFNFEHERLVNFKASDFSLLLESYFELFEPNKREKTYLFLDELQIIPFWQKFLNRLRESGNYKIIISGSNATLLSKEISTQLTGRNIPLELQPLSFCEYLNIKMPDFRKIDIYDLDKIIKIKKTLNQYIKSGGFPEVVKTKYYPLLQEYLRNIIYRDIVLRYKIKYEASLREIVNFVMSNIGSILSLQQIARMTNVKNINTVKNYLKYLEHSFLFYLVPRYSYSVKQQVYNPDKIYICDSGFYDQMGFKFSQNKGRILENFVFLELKRREKAIYYYKTQNNLEVDFVLTRNHKVRQLIQACYQIDNLKTKQREINSLVHASQELKCSDLSVITNDYEAEEKNKNKKIKFIPLWKWLLAN